jgi:uncharacterized repeat protein (TIGR04052 family)
MLLAFGCGSGEIVIAFEGVVGDEPAVCGATYRGIGVTDSELELTDFRLFVHDVRLVTDEGEVPLELIQDGEWQYEDVAHLDFEDGCDRGDLPMNSVVRGTVDRAVDVRGLRFRFGVPFELDHLDVAVAPPPLDDHDLWWSWNQGYSFLRVTGTSTGLTDGFHVLIASTGCVGDNMGNVTSCISENVVDIDIPSFDPREDTVRVDLAALFADANIDTNEGERLCMSGFDDEDCYPIFRALGLRVTGEGEPGPQRVFE